MIPYGRQHITQADIDAGKITNQATVNAKTPDDKTVTDQSGSNANNNDNNIDNNNDNYNGNCK